MCDWHAWQKGIPIFFFSLSEHYVFTCCSLLAQLSPDNLSIIRALSIVYCSQMNQIHSALVPLHVVLQQWLQTPTDCAVPTKTQRLQATNPGNHNLSLKNIRIIWTFWTNLFLETSTLIQRAFGSGEGYCAQSKALILPRLVGWIHTESKSF